MHGAHNIFYKDSHINGRETQSVFLNFTVRCGRTAALRVAGQAVDPGSVSMIRSSHLSVEDTNRAKSKRLFMVSKSIVPQLYALSNMLDES